MVWSGFWKEEAGVETARRKVDYHIDYYHNSTIRFTYVLEEIQETDENGRPVFRRRWVSRKIKWEADGRSQDGGMWMHCKGSGTLDLGPSREWNFYEGMRDEIFGSDWVNPGLGMFNKDDRPSPYISIPCREQSGSSRNDYNDLGVQVWPPHSLRIPQIVPWEKMRRDKDGKPCSYSVEVEAIDDGLGSSYTNTFDLGVLGGYKGDLPGKTGYSVSVSPEYEAAIDVKTDDRSDYWKFVPKPRGKVWFSVRSNIPMLFRFKLENVSRFPGYSTNANIDDAFFWRYSLEHLKKAKYPNDGPDLIFDPKDFEDTKVWKRTNWDTVETVKELKEVNIPVAAMDFGAYGQLWAWMKKRKCEVEQPVKIRVGGQEREFVTIPMDQDDNLIADRVDKPKNGITEWGYKSDPGRDDDQEPKGNGIKGDGLTAFEEYRGFMRSDGYCSEPLKDVHFRTNPNKKDLFIAPDNKKLADAAGKFGYNSGLDVHLICPRHYFNNNTRIVNFTLQRKGAWRPSGKTVTQKEPQHGLYLIVDSAPGVVGEQYGPPKYVRAVAVDPLFAETLYGAIAEAGRMPFFEDKLVLESAVLHELGHAVGIRHHGPDVTPVILDFPSCPPGQDDVIEGTVNGKRACWSSDMIAPHGVTSGNQDCPMRFTNNIVPKWYVTPSSTPVGPAVIQYKDSEGNLNQFEGTGYRGHVKKYRVELERPGVGKFCSSTKGTGINALPGDQNHAGDSRRVCAEQICVNDLKCPTVTP
jgi:hypothetical protein